MAASLGAGISMGFAEALPDDGSLTGRGHPWVRGLICGAMTTLGGIGHTLPFLIKDFTLALGIAIVVVLVELGVITWVRHRYMDTPTFSAALQVGHICRMSLSPVPKTPATALEGGLVKLKLTCG
jgi:erythrin-vacuolar iron transport family protein